MAKILVADDNSNIQKMVGLALKDQGIDVVAVGNGEAAVRKISDVKPDLVLADVFMPVRNGYEVCRYVKEDSSLSHIPVILLVGAFDPLDEQEAQRVGADGVLKKPFVPPDPLISMVKSALTRAGVPIGNEPPAEKAPESVAGHSAKTAMAPSANLKAAPIPEAEAEPVEEFPAPPQAVKIAEGSQPVAFGSLLETPEAEDDMAFVAKPIEELEQARNWGGGSETEEAEQDEEEETPSRGGWRPGGLEDAVEQAATKPGRNGAKDWRDEAFHGNSPANISSGRAWTPAQTTQVAEPASVGVSTLEQKPSEAPAPFAGDAWAAALANTVEGKIATVTEAAAPVNEAAAEVAAPAVETKPAESAAAPSARAAEAPSWGSTSESPWELEAKKASLLAATWDAPAATPTEPAGVAEAEKFLAEEPEAAPAAASPEAAIPDFVQRNAEQTEAVGQEAPATAPAAGEEVAQTGSAGGEFLSEAPAPESATSDLAYVAESPLDVNATQELPAYAAESGNYSAAPLQEEEPRHAEEAQPARMEEATEQATPSFLAAAEPEAAPATQAQQPDMDALVARVLAKMNPEVLQKVTQEILKPVIEAIIKDELESKK